MAIGNLVTTEAVPAQLSGLEEVLALGRTVRDVRTARGMTLTELAQKCGKSVGYLSQVENGRARPTIASLRAVAKALAVELSFFFPSSPGSNTAERAYVVRRPGARRLTLEGGIANDLLSPDLAGPIELLRTTMEPGAWSGDDYGHRGHEAGYVLEGTFELWIEGECFTLQAGDSFAFACDKPHRFGNPGAAPVTVLWVLTPPTV